VSFASLAGRATALVRAFVPVVILYAGVTLSGGLSQSPSAGDYRFSPDSGVGSGIYTQMGSGDGFVYLRSCDKLPRIIAVRADAVLSVSLLRNVWWYRPAVLVAASQYGGGLEIGPRYQCETPSE
jgi:hypothetical protein